ncbi:MAG TPA: 50S ribosomal protein L9 [Rhodothermales bacterium]|nr:50S ribosomal protein L9 [Rhodothermales bacterium]
MKVILLQDVDNLGEEGEIVTVKPGYGRNYLIPKGQALIATKGAVKARHEEMRQQARKRAQAKDDAEALKQQIEQGEVVVEAKVGEENRIFGTVTSQQVAVKLALQGYNIDRRNIELLEDIRMIGVYTANVKLHSDVTAQLKVRVVPEGGEAADTSDAADTEAEATEEA